MPCVIRASKGNPTRLVRDGDVEGSDPVADEPFKITPTRVEGHPVTDGSDLLRADDNGLEGPFDSKTDDLAAYGSVAPKNMGIATGNPIGNWVRSLRRRGRRPK